MKVNKKHLNHKALINNKTNKIKANIIIKVTQSQIYNPKLLAAKVKKQIL